MKLIPNPKKLPRAILLIFTHLILLIVITALWLRVQELEAASKHQLSKESQTIVPTGPTLSIKNCDYNHIQEIVSSGEKFSIVTIQGDWEYVDTFCRKKLTDIIRGQIKELLAVQLGALEYYTGGKFFITYWNEQTGWDKTILATYDLATNTTTKLAQFDEVLDVSDFHYVAPEEDLVASFKSDEVLLLQVNTIPTGCESDASCEAFGKYVESVVTNYKGLWEYNIATSVLKKLN